MLTALYLILSALFVFLLWQVSSLKRNSYVLLLLLVRGERLCGALPRRDLRRDFLSATGL